MRGGYRRQWGSQHSDGGGASRFRNYSPKLVSDLTINCTQWWSEVC